MRVAVPDREAPMRRTMAFAAVGVAMALGLAACGGGKSTAEKLVDKASDGKVKVDHNGVTFKDDNGNSASIGAGSELPKDFPKDAVPLPKGKVTGSISGTTDGKSSWTVTVEPSDSVSDATDAYRSALESAGYKINNSFNAGSGDSAVISFMAVGTTYDVNVAGAADKTTNGIVVTVAPHDPSNDPRTTDASSN
jgi:hypothetical protein